MKNSMPAKGETIQAFTLVELLTVIAIIGILAALLLTVLPRVIINTKVRQAKMEMSTLVTAIESFDQDYSRYPVTAAEQTAAGTNDFTTGLVFSTGPASFDNNSNVVAILMDLTAYPNGNPTANTGHILNPKQVKYLNAKMSGDTNSPGVGTDLIYRDPWGNPYVITLDLSGDDQCSDLLYSLSSVSSQNGSSGYNGLFNPTYPANANNFLYHGKVMVWSAGPDGKYDTNPAGGPNVGVNKDNVLSW